MDLYVYVLLLLSLTVTGLRDDRFDDDHSELTPAELQVLLAGLTYMSRSLYLETLHGTKEAAEETAKEVLQGVIVETNSLLILNHSEIEPVKDKLTAHELLSGLGTWELQTTSFLTELASTNDLFRGHKHEEHLVGNLTHFKKGCTGFFHGFEHVLPDLRDIVGNSQGLLGAAGLYAETRTAAVR
ncbi:hypothetical protein VTK73DRAFT_8851 [Phialemonium thermophilum]|uniref:Uncharacterized protein n=1 Tax=Phialemonium thermophilum TaxID=223376 RepID=A0ABR3XNE0_9PEZI